MSFNWIRISNSMRILINGINYYPELTGIGKYTGEMAKWLAEQGHSVKVICAPPYYPEWKIADGYSGVRYQKTITSGVEVIRCPVWVPDKPTGITRIIHLLSFAVSSMPLMLWNAVFWRPDVVFVVEPPLFCAPTSWMAAKIARAKSWLHVQDLEVDAAFDLGILSSSFIRKIILAVEKFLLRRFDCVSTISSKMMERLREKGVENERLVYFPNWVDVDYIYPINRPSLFREKFDIPKDTLVLLYSGNMGKKQGLEVIIEVAISLLDRHNILFLLCGNGAIRNEIESKAKNIKNIRLFGLQPASLLNELLNLADIHLLPQREDIEDLVMPSKLVSMVASGKPVITTARKGTQVAELVEKCGLVVNPGDTEALRASILELAEQPARRDELGRIAREYAIDNWEKQKVLGDLFK